MIWVVNIFVFLSFNLNFGLSFFGFDIANFKLLRSNETLKNRSETEEWITLRVDHFNATDKRTWRMRYFKNLTYHKARGPIIIQMGVQTYARDEFVDFAVDLARETGGALYTNEHRYYGQSYPLRILDYEDFKNYEFLSALQSLVDVAALLTKLKKRKEYATSKVVAIGGSYGGSLAVWLRQLYPGLVDAAHASSAPLLAKVDFYEYMEKVSEDYEAHCSPGDFDRIKRKFAHYDAALKTAAGIKQLENELNICEGVDLRDTLNQQELFRTLLLKFEFSAQYGSPESIKIDCAIYAEAMDHWMELKDQECLNVSIENSISSMRNDPWSLNYQACNEFGYFQTLSSPKQIFTNRLTVGLYKAMCARLFGPHFGGDRVTRGVARTNKLYGGLTPNVTNVVFVNGDLDPWSRLSVTKDLSPAAPAKVIHGTSLCKDLFHSNLTQVIEAQNFSKKMIKQWIGFKEVVFKPPPLLNITKSETETKQ